MSGEDRRDPITLTERDGGRTVPVPMGAAVVLRLPEIPSTGLRWRVPDAPGLGVTADRWEAAGGGVGAGVGAGGHRVLRLEPRAPGRVRIAIVREQAWDPAVADGRFEVTLDVREGRADALKGPVDLD